MAADRIDFHAWPDADGHFVIDTLSAGDVTLTISAEPMRGTLTDEETRAIAAGLMPTLIFPPAAL